ncbi:hypothetical protein AF332_17365 [Sporosarcina globispora]|uniref:Uncharacterized protein n=1 Tax=Sporosarcina globispora TaxID=1459 RepID=A0A0M0GFZ2_SPOGL|nr:hypothetical protein [Sporosarcina globispora]KON88402.1 hypothetical protein AF332_17365 [Sporosarcina globispora]
MNIVYAMLGKGCKNLPVHRKVMDSYCSNFVWVPGTFLNARYIIGTMISVRMTVNVMPEMMVMASSVNRKVWL